jgi:hypothetical protein
MNIFPLRKVRITLEHNVNSTSLDPSIRPVDEHSALATLGIAFYRTPCLVPSPQTSPAFLYLVWSNGSFLPSFKLYSRVLERDIGFHRYSLFFFFLFCFSDGNFRRNSLFPSRQLPRLSFFFVLDD